MNSHVLRAYHGKTKIGSLHPLLNTHCFMMEAQQILIWKMTHPGGTLNGGTDLALNAFGKERCVFLRVVLPSWKRESVRELTMMKQET